MSKSQKFFIIGITLSAGILILAQAFKLVYVQGYKYQSMSDENRVRKKAISAKRGSIKDRNGEVLVQDVPANNGFVRSYAVGEPFGHILGYVGEESSNKAEPAGGECSGNTLTAGGGRVGLGGIEKALECLLRGAAGVTYEEVDAHEKSGKYLERVPPREGDEVVLTIDKNLQEKVYESFDGIPGAAVVLDARSGEVIALASYPSYDPGKMGTDSKETEKYLADTEKPLFNRATLGIYPPGSVYKMVVAAAALEEKKIKPQDTVLDTGFRMVGGKKYTNWFYTEYGGRTDGEVDMVKALKRSNDIYFYEMGERLGVQTIAKYSQLFGYGARSGIELEDVEGVVPSTFWKKEKVGEKWFLGDTYNFSIGQGYLLSTPLQVAVMTQIIANDGTRCTPTILSSVTRSKYAGSTRSCTKLQIDKEVFAVIKKGMEEACAIKGTAWTFFDLNSPNESSTSAEFVHYKNPIRVACKTGTAEHFVEGNEEPHGWLTLFAPSHDPKVVITVLAEKGGQGSDSAGRVARRILDEAIKMGYVR